MPQIFGSSIRTSMKYGSDTLLEFLYFSTSNVRTNLTRSYVRMITSYKEEKYKFIFVADGTQLVLILKYIEYSFICSIRTKATNSWSLIDSYTPEILIYFWTQPKFQILALTAYK